MPTVGDRIRQIREDMEMNQEQLAERAGLSKGFLSDVENGKRNIASENLLKIANVLGASVDYLLRGEVTESAKTEPVIIPPELAQAAEESEWSYAATVELLEAHRSVIARQERYGGGTNSRNAAIRRASVESERGYSIILRIASPANSGAFDAIPRVRPEWIRALHFRARPRCPVVGDVRSYRTRSG